MTGTSEALRRKANAHGHALAFVMIDADNFKQINDVYGHTVGDQALVEMAQRIQSILLQGAYLARLGGDEFAFAAAYDPAEPERIEDLGSVLIRATI